jgi:hypothetical protein
MFERPNLLFFTNHRKVLSLFSLFETDLFAQNVSGCESGKTQQNSRIAENFVRPQHMGRLFKGCKVFGAHFDVDLNGTFSTCFHPPYRYVGTLLSQGYYWYLSYHND